MPNLSVVKGILAIVFGCMFIIMSYSIIIRMTLFTAGLFLIYYGIKMLNVPQIEQGIHKTKDYFKKMIS